MKSISLASRELRQTVHCLELYYRQGRSQKDIARALGVSAATVSRLLKRAFDEGLVRVELDLLLDLSFALIPVKGKIEELLKY